MKSKIVLFLIVLFLSAIGINAQPGCYFKYRFNPFSLCGTEFQKSEFIFYGEVSTFSYIGGLPTAKAKIKVIDTFKGKVPKEIEIHFDSNQIYCGPLDVKNRYIFLVSKAKINNQRGYSVESWSRSVTDYSKKGLEEVFAGIQSFLANKLQLGLQGYVLETSTSRNLQLSRDAKDRVLFYDDFFRTFPNVIVQATNETDGKIYHTKTNIEGKYVFDNLPFGKYRLTAFIKDKQAFPKNVEVTGKICDSRYYIPVAAIK